MKKGELTEKAKAYYESTDKAIIYILGGSFYELSCYLYGIEDFMMAMALTPEKVHAHLDAHLALQLKSLEESFLRIGKTYCGRELRSWGRPN